MNYGKTEQLLRALVRSDMETYRALGEELDRERWPDTGTFLTSTFYLAVLRKFQEGQPMADIVSYVADLRSRLPETDELDPRAAELMLRLIVHDGISVSELTPAQRIHAQQMIIFDIISNENLSDQQLDAFFADVRQFLHENASAE